MKLSLFADHQTLVSRPCPFNIIAMTASKVTECRRPRSGGLAFADPDESLEGIIPLHMSCSRIDIAFQAMQSISFLPMTQSRCAIRAKHSSRSKANHNGVAREQKIQQINQILCLRNCAAMQRIYSSGSVPLSSLGLEVELGPSPESSFRFFQTTPGQS